MKHDKIILQFENFKNEKQNLCKKVSVLSVRISQMKSKINKLVERNLCCNNAESLKNKEKILLKKQLVKASESEKSKEQKY